MKLEIPTSLCEGLIFYFLVESVNLFISISASILSCCVSFIHMMIYSIMFLMFLVLHIALILVSTTLKAIIQNPIMFELLQIVNYPLTKSKVCHYQLWFTLCIFIVFPFTYCKLSYIIVRCLLLWFMYWWMWCFLSVFFYRLFTP